MSSERVIALLESIDASLKVLVERKRAAAPKAIASDRELDGQYGNPVLKFQPRDWTGPSFKNRTFSECPPELLDLVAESNDWFAQQAEQKNEKTAKGKPVAEFKRADAARARGWAKRIREGKHIQTASNDGWTPEPEANEPAANEWVDAEQVRW